jgi:hypothetical protein
VPGLYHGPLMDRYLCAGLAKSVPSLLGLGSPGSGSNLLGLAVLPEAAGLPRSWAVQVGPTAGSARDPGQPRPLSRAGKLARPPRQSSGHLPFYWRQVGALALAQQPQDSDSCGPLADRRAGGGQAAMGPDPCRSCKISTGSLQSR